MLGMNGAYTTIARGYQCVGINPANLAYSGKFSINLMTFNFGMGNNLMSLENYNDLNGADLDNSEADNYYPKENILNELNDRDLQITAEGSLFLPFINFSKENVAITTMCRGVGYANAPNSMIDLFLNGNELGRDYNLNFNENLLGVIENGLSFSLPYDGFAIGFTFKYLQGILNFNLNPINTFIQSDSTTFSLNAQYLMRQAIGGSGYGIDIGIITDESKNGWSFGASLTNIFGDINWNEPNFTHTILNDYLESSIPFRQNEYYYYSYSIDSVNFISLINSEFDSLLIRDDFAVVELNNSYNNEDCIQYGDICLIPSETISDAELDTMQVTPFSVDYPSIFRIGVSKTYPEAVIAFDLSTGFHDGMDSYDAWKFAFGTEITRFDKIPLRMGYSIGGKDKVSMSFGFGYHIKSLHFDIGVALRNGLLLHTAQGVDFGISLSWFQ